MSGAREAGLSAHERHEPEPRHIGMCRYKVAPRCGVTRRQECLYRHASVHRFVVAGLDWVIRRFRLVVPFG